MSSKLPFCSSIDELRIAFVSALVLLLLRLLIACLQTLIMELGEPLIT